MAGFANHPLRNIAGDTGFVFDYLFFRFYAILITVFLYRFNENVSFRKQYPLQIYIIRCHLPNFISFIFNIYDFVSIYLRLCFTYVILAEREFFENVA